MGKTGKWFKSFLTGKKEKDQKNTNGNCINNQSNSTNHQNPTTPKEKKRWSFRRSSATNTNTTATTTAIAKSADAINAQPNESGESAAAAAAAAAAVVEKPAHEGDTDSGAAVSNATVGLANPVNNCILEEAAAVKIQSVYRSYLARKALKALRGLVKLQALVRGHLVRKQATATLRCMQALVTAQARARAQRIQSVDEGKITNHRQSTHRRNSQEKIKHTYPDMEENIKIVEMDRGEFRSNINSRNNYSNPSQQHINERMDNRISTYYSSPNPKLYIQDQYPQYSPAPSGITDMSPRTCSGHFEDYSFATAQSSPQCNSALSRPDPCATPFSFPKPEYAETMSYDFPLYPNYMANTESSRAKVRSQSAPKQRPEFERQPSRGRRPSIEGRNIPKGAKMQRSSSHVGSTAQNYQYPWSVKLDKSTISLRDSECGSTCSMATNAYYCRSVVSYDPRC